MDCKANLTIIDGGSNVSRLEFNNLKDCFSEANAAIWRPSKGQARKVSLEYGDTRMRWHWKREGALKIEFKLSLGEKEGSSVSLRARSISSKDQDLLGGVFQDTEARAYYGSGQAAPDERVASTTRLWASRWEEDGTPNSAFAVFKKSKQRAGGNYESSKQYVGLVNMGPSGKPGYAEPAILLKKVGQQQGIGSAFAKVLINMYAPAVKANGVPFSGEPLKAIFAPANLVDSAPSYKLVEAFGFRAAREDELPEAESVRTETVDGAIERLVGERTVERTDGQETYKKAFYVYDL